MTPEGALFMARAKWFPWTPSVKVRRILGPVGLIWFMVNLLGYGVALGVMAVQANAEINPPPAWRLMASLALNGAISLLLIWQMPVKPCPCCGLPRKGHPEKVPA